MADKPSKGLADVVAASTALSDIDGQAGRLFYRGYDIHQLAGASTFEEIAYLLQRGSAPGLGELGGYRAELVAGRTLGTLVSSTLPQIAASQGPMEAMRSLVSLASADDPDESSNAAAANERKAARLTAQQPILVAAYHAAREGRECVPADPGLSLAANFLFQLRGTAPSARDAEILDTCLVLHADHTMNASTFAARVCAATLSDMHSAVVAALGTLKGPLHGGANEQVMRGLEAIRASGGADPVAAVGPVVRERLGAGEKIMGFGHRVYKTEDPRATHLRQMSGELAAASGDDTYYRMSRADGGDRVRGEGPLSQRGLLRRHRLPLPGHSHGPVHPGLLGQPDGRLDRPRDGAARGQPADPAGQRVHRRARPHLGRSKRAVVMPTR